MEAVNEVVSYLNANQPVLLGLASIIAIVLHELAKKVVGFGKFTNKFLGFVLLPGVVTALVAFGTSLHLSQYPVVAIVAQLLYAVVQKYNTSLINNVAVAVEPDGTTASF